jgi:type IV secretory pathway VirB3-like protein
MAFVVVAFMVMAFVLVANNSSFRRIWLKVSFNGVGRTQRFAFQARWAPIKLPI